MYLSSGLYTGRDDTRLTYRLNHLDMAARRQPPTHSSRLVVSSMPPKTSPRYKAGISCIRFGKGAVRSNAFDAFTIRLGNVALSTSQYIRQDLHGE